MNTKVIVGGVAVVLLIIGAMYFMTKNSSAPAGGDQQMQQAAVSTATGTSTLGQVQGQDVAIGTGAEAKPGDIVSVLYEGKLQDGTVFDSSAAHGGAPLKFVLGTNELIPGFQIGVNGMKVGGERVLSVPPALGYGDKDVTDPATSKVIIPANSTILFNVKLVAVEPGTTTPAQQ